MVSFSTIDVDSIPTTLIKGKFPFYPVDNSHFTLGTAVKLPVNVTLQG